jgi:hypothetical protein
MHHDPKLTIEKLVSTPSLLDETAIIAEAQRLRGQMFGQWLRRVFARVRRPVGETLHRGSVPAGPLKWYGS